MTDDENGSLKAFPALPKFDLEAHSVHEDKVPVSFWLSREYKNKFATLQRMTKKEFGRYCQDHLKILIDSVPLEKEGA